MQAVINAKMRGDEYVMEALATFDKMKMLIEEIITAQIWKTKVLPLLKDEVLK